MGDPVRIPFRELCTRAENELSQNAVLNTTIAFLRRPSGLFKSDQYIFKGNVNISCIEEWRNLYFPPIKEGSYYVSLVMLYKNETAWITKIFHSNMFFMYGLSIDVSQWGPHQDVITLIDKNTPALNLELCDKHGISKVPSSDYALFIIIKQLRDASGNGNIIAFKRLKPFTSSWSLELLISKEQIKNRFYTIAIIAAKDYDLRFSKDSTIPHHNFHLIYLKSPIIISDNRIASYYSKRRNNVWTIDPRINLDKCTNPLPIIGINNTSIWYNNATNHFGLPIFIKNKISIISFYMYHIRELSDSSTAIVSGTFKFPEEGYLPPSTGLLFMRVNLTSLSEHFCWKTGYYIKIEIEFKDRAKLCYKSKTFAIYDAKWISGKLDIDIEYEIYNPDDQPPQYLEMKTATFTPMIFYGKIYIENIKFLQFISLEKIESSKFVSKTQSIDSKIAIIYPIFFYNTSLESFGQYYGGASMTEIG